MSPEPRRYDVRVELTEDPRPRTAGESFSRRILNGDFDEDLEHILEAAHHRKRELRERRYGR